MVASGMQKSASQYSPVMLLRLALHIRGSAMPLGYGVKKVRRVRLGAEHATTPIALGNAAPEPYRASIVRPLSCSPSFVRVAIKLAPHGAEYAKE